MRSTISFTLTLGLIPRSTIIASNSSRNSTNPSLGLIESEELSGPPGPSSEPFAKII